MKVNLNAKGIMRDRIYFENLDGLRFFAFFSVFLYHSFYTPYEYILNNDFFVFFHKLTRIGYQGVNFFFVLSGFLITYLLTIEEDKHKTIHIGRFYMRRVLRIWPLYYLIVFFCFFIYPYLETYFAETPSGKNDDILFFLFHLSNLHYINTPSEIPTLNILWSISIEEQFYFFWPLLFLFFKRNSRIVLLILLIFIAQIFIYISAEDHKLVSHHLLSCMSDLSVGSLCAVLIIRSKRFLQGLKNMPIVFISVIYALGFLYLGLQVVKIISNINLLTSLFFAFVILEQTFSDNSILKISTLKLFSRLGKYTYGLYCYHYLALLFAIELSQMLGTSQYLLGVLVLENLIALLVAIVVAVASYHLFEAPFLRMKDKFNPLLQTLK